MFVPGMPFQLCPMFVGKVRTGTYPRVEHLKRASPGFALNPVANIRPDWKGLPGTNTLAYYEHS
jgi:hypothetical protein